MNQKIILALLICAVALLCLGVWMVSRPQAITEPMPTQTSVKPIVKHMASVDILPIYETVSLQEGEDLEVLDVNGNLVLMQVVHAYTQDEFEFNEEGYNMATRELLLYDLQSQAVTASYPVSERSYCNSAVLKDSFFYYVLLTPEVLETGVSAYAAQYAILGQMLDSETLMTYVTSDCLATGYDNPYLAELDGDAVAFSFYEEETGAFGVSILTKDGTVKPQLSYANTEGTEHLRSIFYGNGSEYIYYAAIEGNGTFFIGNETEVQASFAIDSSERVYAYALLEDHVLLSLELEVEASVQDRFATRQALVVRDYQGNTIAEVEPALTRLASNGVNCALGNALGSTSYGRYMGYSGLTVAFWDGESLEIQKLTEDSKIFAAFPIDNTHYLVQHSKWGDQEPAFELITIE